jgi:hypothetical protein
VVTVPATSALPPPDPVPAATCSPVGRRPVPAGAVLPEDANTRAGLEEGIAELAAAAASSASSTGLFGTHAEMAGKYLNRNLGAMKGIYGLPTSEAWYGGWLLDSAGDHPVGAHPHTVTFTADQPPRSGSSGP